MRVAIVTIAVDAVAVAAISVASVSVATIVTIAVRVVGTGASIVWLGCTDEFNVALLDGSD